MEEFAEQTPADYKLVIEQRPDYLFVHVSEGRDNYANSIDYWRRVAAAVSQSDCRKVLIFEDLVGEVPISEMYRLATEIPRLGLTGVTVAFVDEHANQRAANEFGELVATNRGATGKVFTDFDTAEKWLLSR